MPLRSHKQLKNATKIIAMNAAVAALYVVFTMPFGTLAINPYVQIRPAEALTILPALMPWSIVGLTVGCAVSNIISTFGILDVLLGSTITLIAGLLTAFVFKKFYLAPIPPVVLNALLLPVVWLLAAPEGVTWSVYLLEVLGLLVSQSVVCFGLGIPLYFATRKHLLPLLNR